MPKDKHPHLSIVTDTGDKLTAKQEHFCQMVAQGETLTEAYRQAYDVKEGTKPSTVWANASKLATENTKVAQRIKSITEEITARKRPDEDRLRIWVTDRLKEEAVSGSDTSASEIEADLQRRLALLMSE